MLSNKSILSPQTVVYLVLNPSDINFNFADNHINFNFADNHINFNFAHNHINFNFADNHINFNFAHNHINFNFDNQLQYAARTLRMTVIPFVRSQNFLTAT